MNVKDVKIRKKKLKIVINRYKNLLATIQNREPVLPFLQFVASAHYEKKFLDVIKKDENNHGTSLRELTYTKLSHVTRKIPNSIIMN